MIFPRGFPLRIETNSEDVIQAAEESWGCYKQEFDTAPLHMRVIVQPEGQLSPKPKFRQQQHYFMVVADADNFATADFRAGFACIFVSARTAADHSWLRWYFVESMAYTLLDQLHTASIHAACVARNDSGILLCAKSTGGKSTLAWACARAGWTFIGDDCVMLLMESTDRVVLGKPHQARLRHDAPRLFPELEGYDTSARPNGKLSIEVDPRTFPQIRTASRCQVDNLVFLDRRSGARPGLSHVTKAEALDLLTEDGGYYGEEFYQRHRQAIGRLVEVPAYRLRYERLEDAMQLLSSLAPRYDVQIAQSLV